MFICPGSARLVGRHTLSPLLGCFKAVCVPGAVVVVADDIAPGIDAAVAGDEGAGHVGQA